MKPVVFHREALHELDEAAASNKASPPASSPSSQPVPSTPLQHKKLRGFAFAELPKNWPYRLIVLVEPERFVVLAVAHDRRRAAE